MLGKLLKLVNLLSCQVLKLKKCMKFVYIVDLVALLIVILNLWTILVEISMNEDCIPQNGGAAS